jgi:ABC-type sulfate/molybdate transport systems ATPase subunit
MLMDEPLGALDRHLREQLKFEIKRIQQDFRMTVLFETDDQEEALVLSDRSVVMRDGGIEQEAAPREPGRTTGSWPISSASRTAALPDQRRPYPASATACSTRRPSPRPIGIAES